MENEIYLSFINTLRSALTARSGHIQVILGPRQVGKTTTVLKFIREELPDAAHYVSADDVFNPDRDWLVEQWMQANGEGKVLFIDEIQRCHDWASTLKGLYDRAKREKRLAQCVVLGSSSLDSQKGLSESLTGRHQLIRAHHWNVSESKRGYQLSFNDCLQYGGYPGSYQFINTPSWHQFLQKSIASTVIDKDILLYNTVKNPALFRQAFELLVSYPAQEISYTKLLGQLQDAGNVELVKYYISLYEGAFLLRALEKFSNKAHLQRSSSPKILPLAPSLPFLEIREDCTPEERGRLFEVLVGSQLDRLDEPLYYWREGDAEVDFVVRKGKKIYAIEVKSSRTKKLKGISKFLQKFPTSKAVLITSENYTEFEENPLLFLERHGE
ncbi:ATP-binding protein [bacterium]|nr:ATP-binding protein [bacterium]